MVYGLWFMVHASWFIVHGSSFIEGIRASAQKVYPPKRRTSPQLLGAEGFYLLLITHYLLLGCLLPISYFLLPTLLPLRPLNYFGNRKSTPREVKSFCQSCRIIEDSG
jgi:hypothetical protein